MVPKISIITFFIRFVCSILDLFIYLQNIIFLVGGLSILSGTFFALAQKRLKRLMIYSSIAQVGFLVIALAINTFDSSVAIYFYLFIYLITSILI